MVFNTGHIISRLSNFFTVTVHRDTWTCAITDLPGRRALRSAYTSRLVVTPSKLSAVGSYAFPFAAALIWNSLHCILSIILKTHLF